MPYVYSQVDNLEGKSLVSTGSCAALVQYYTRMGLTNTWKEGENVRKNREITKGTAVATFENGKYPNRPHGNHAAFYLSQDGMGIWVMDQWKEKGKISRRRLYFKGKSSSGKYIDPSNNGDALSIIE